MSPFLLNVPDYVIEEENKSEVSFMEKLDFQKQKNDGEIWIKDKIP
jgi:hypothetical protein